MKDILLDRDRDIRLTEARDISLVTSPVQEVLIRFRGYFAEWVFDPEKGIPWFESVLVKNPDIDGIRKRLTREMLEADDVLEVTRLDIRVDPESRNAVIRFQFRTDKETYDEEVILHG